jgi:hypothetical protein
MKVIAKTGNGYLLEASPSELAQLQGYTSEYSNGYQKSTDRIGDEIDISKMVQIASYTRTLAPEVIRETIVRLEATIGKLQSAGELVEKLNLFDKLKD